MTPSQPKVSVSIITYNHARYIAQALDSVLTQETNFEYEILIGEDDSSDGTREIVKAYAEKYPDKIRLFLNDRKNVIYINGRPTGRWNFVNNIKQARDEYIALLDGDDYWTSPHKLQEQVDFLDSHLDCCTCCHNVEVRREDDPNFVSHFCPPEQKPFGTLDDYLVRYFVPTCSVMTRLSLLQSLPDWFMQIPIGDVPLQVIALSRMENGRIGYLNKVMAVYRVHDDGVWSGIREIERMLVDIQTYLMLERIVPEKNMSSLKRRFSQSFYNLGICLANQTFERSQFPTVQMAKHISGVEERFEMLPLDEQTSLQIRKGFYDRLFLKKGTFRMFSPIIVFKIVFQTFLNHPIVAFRAYDEQKTAQGNAVFWRRKLK